VNPSSATESKELLRRAAEKVAERGVAKTTDNHFEVGALEDSVTYSDFLAALRSESKPDRAPDGT
jgi:hypothetical protein